MGRSGDESRPLDGAAAEAAFDAVYTATFRDVAAYCQRRLGAVADIEDVLADIYLVAWRRLEDLIAADSQLAWLYAVAHRTLANRRRAAGRAARLKAVLARSAPPEATDDPALAAEEQEEYEVVHLALADLPATDQELLQLAVFEDLSISEIAVVLGTRPALVRSKMYRARRRLQRAYDRREGRR